VDLCADALRSVIGAVNKAARPLLAAFERPPVSYRLKGAGLQTEPRASCYLGPIGCSCRPRAAAENPGSGKGLSSRSVDVSKARSLGVDFAK
jgi:hypothetical protein